MRKCFILLLAVVLCLFSGCGENRDYTYISEQCGIDFSEGTIISSHDTHGGFHNDGYKLIILQLDDNSVTEKIKTNEHWYMLPLTENIFEFLYQPFDDSLKIPEIKNGYYYFMDRHPESKDHFDDTDLLSRPSFNFTVAIFDTDTSKLYFVKYDT